MAGTLVANTINTDTGLFSTNNAYLGIAKAWVNYNGSTQTIVGSFNVSSVTRNSTGDYTINFTTAMPNANLCATTNCSDDVTGGSSSRIIGSIRTLATTSVRISSQGISAATYYDSVYCGVSVFSS